MIGAIKDRVTAIVGALTPPVPPAQVFRGKDALAGRHAVYPRVVLVTDVEKSEPMGDLVKVEDDRVAKVRRYTTRRARRTVDVVVVVQHHSEEQAEAVLQPTIAELLDGLVVDDMPVTAWRSDATWVNELSASRQSPGEVHAGVRFEGGIYRTRTVPLLTDIAVQGEVIHGAQGE